LLFFSSDRIATGAAIAATVATTLDRFRRSKL
jgi:hypothetical protein